jgi:hypothetical protein
MNQEGGNFMLMRLPLLQGEDQKRKSHLPAHLLLSNLNMGLKMKVTGLMITWFYNLKMVLTTSK